MSPFTSQNTEYKIPYDYFVQQTAFRASQEVSTSDYVYLSVELVWSRSLVKVCSNLYHHVGAKEKLQEDMER